MKSSHCKCYLFSFFKKRYFLFRSISAYVLICFKVFLMFFVHLVAQEVPQEFYEFKLNDIKYDYDENHNLIVIHNIKEATSDGSKWLLKGVESIYVNKIPVTKEMHDKKSLVNFIDKNLIMIKTDKSESLSLSDVIKNISYLEQNNLDSDIQKKIFWEKLFQPFSAVIMLFLALPFIFGKLRSTQTSKRIIIGLFIGIAFFIFP